MNRRHFWLVMQYACDRCGHRIEFYLEDGCEGPKDRQVPWPREWEHMRSSVPAAIRPTVPPSVPQTASGRFVLPVPFVAAACPKCQPRRPWRPDRGVLQHVNWGADRVVSTSEPPARAGRFHYPDDWAKDSACGMPILPELSAAGGAR